MFRREQTPILIAERIYQMPEVMELAKSGNLGVAPMPKDPQTDAHYVRGCVGGYFIPKGAKNPKGAMAVVSTMVFRESDQTEKNKEYELWKTAYHLSDENIRQLDAAFISGVTPVLEMTPWIGYDTVWLMVGNNVNWATQVAADAPRVNARIAELFEKNEYDAPTGPKVIDDFEKYGSDVNAPIARYTPVSGGETDVSVKLVKGDVKEGVYAARIDFNLKERSGRNPTEQLWGGVGRSINKSWNGNDTMRLWLKNDGQKRTVGLQFITAGGATWSYKMELSGNEWKQYDIPLAEFKLPEWSEQADLDLTNISMFNISFGSDNPQKGWLMIDKIEVVAK